MSFTLRIAAALLVLSGFAAAANPQVSSPAERKRALEVIDKLELNAMDPSLKAEREWVFQWVKASDVDALVCTGIMKPLSDEKPSPFRNALMLQNILASARFSMQHPQSKDRLAMFEASTEGVIRAYQNLIKQDPSRKNAFMESLIVKQQTGQLMSYVRKNANECAKHPATTLEP
jgi:hypothetical protein